MSAGLKGAPTRIVVICLFVALGSRANTQGTAHADLFSTSDNTSKGGRDDESRQRNV